MVKFPIYSGITQYLSIYLWLGIHIPDEYRNKDRLLQVGTLPVVVALFLGWDLCSNDDDGRNRARGRQPRRRLPSSDAGRADRGRHVPICYA